MPIRARIPVRAVGGHPRHSCPHGPENFLRESHPRIVRVNRAPTRSAKHPSRSQQHGTSGSRKDEQQTGREGFGFGTSRLSHTFKEGISFASCTFANSNCFVRVS